MWPNPQETADLVTLTEEILNGKLHFLCRVQSWNMQNIAMFKTHTYSESSQRFKTECFAKIVKLYNYFSKALYLRSLTGFWIWPSLNKYSITSESYHIQNPGISTIIHKYLRQNLVFMWDSALREKFSFWFFKRFLLVLTKFSFRQKDRALGNNSMKFWDFPDIF